MNGNCSSLTPAELEVTVFGQGKHQQLQAIAMCQGCPIKNECSEIALELDDQAWGVFGGKAYRAGVVVRQEM